MVASHQSNFTSRHSASRYFKRAVFAVCAIAVCGVSHAAVSLTLANGITNPAASLDSTGLNPKQTAVAHTVALVPVANFSAVLQSVMTAQGFTAANNWSLVANTVTLANNATFNITAYDLFLNGTGTAFGQNFDVTLNPNAASPPVPNGSVATLHWLQFVNTNAKINNYGYAINGQQGFWQLDNGQVDGAAAAGAATGPYYDSNAPGFSVPPDFHDGPQFYSGVGTYLNFTLIPAWDIFTPAGGGNPAKEEVHVADFGVSWGFQIVPEPNFATLLLVSTVLLQFNRKRNCA